MKKTLLSIITLTMLSLSVSSQNVGDTAPEFSLTDLNGNTIALSQFKGKVVALFIFGNTCPSCIAIAPDVQKKIQETFAGNSNFVLLGLDQWDGNKASVESFKSQTGATFSLLQKASGTASSYKITYDRLIIIDQQGKIAFKGTKLVSSDLNAAISSINNLLVVTDIPKIQNTANIELYPNPVASSLNIKLHASTSEKISISITNMLGEKIYSLNNTVTSSESYTLNLESLAQGIYFTNVTIGTNQQIFKIIKK